MTVIERVIVAGLGRCGSSLTMQMIAAGGISTHGVFPSFEVDRAMPGQLTTAWLSRQRGAIKVLDPHRFEPAVFNLPGNVVIWLERNPDEQARSQAKFLELVADQPRPNRKAVRGLGALVRADTMKVRRMFGRLKVPVLMLTFEDLVTEPDWSASALGNFLATLAPNAPAMARAVKPRGPECLPDLLELELVA